jgi:hypothetical protein
MLSEPEGTPFKCLPRLDHGQVYKAVFETLNSGNCIGIFPEGGSHDRTKILPLKGSSISLLQEKQDQSLVVKISSRNFISWSYDNGPRRDGREP